MRTELMSSGAGALLGFALITATGTEPRLALSSAGFAFLVTLTAVTLIRMLIMGDEWAKN